MLIGGLTDERVRFEPDTDIAEIVEEVRLCTTVLTRLDLVIKKAAVPIWLFVENSAETIVEEEKRSQTVLF